MPWGGYFLEVRKDDARLHQAQHGYGATELALRKHLAIATVDVWQQCLALAHQAWPLLPAPNQPLLAALFPDAPGLANAIADALTDRTDRRQ